MLPELASLWTDVCVPLRSDVTPHVYCLYQIFFCCLTLLVDAYIAEQAQLVSTSSQ